jgi:hypothetical protein
MTPPSRDSPFSQSWEHLANNTVIAPRASQSSARARADTYDAANPPSTATREQHGDLCAVRQRDTHKTLRTPMQHSTRKSRVHAGRPAQPQPLYTEITSISLHTAAARTPHPTYRTAQFRALHTPLTENHTQSHSRPPRHTHVRAVRLPSVDGMLPKRVLLLKSNSLQDTRTAIASHHGTRRRHRPQPVAHNASQCIASHSINRIKSNDKPVSTLHAIAHAQHRARVTQKRHNQTAYRYLTPSSHHTSQRHCDGRARLNATTAIPCTCKQALGTQQQQHSDYKQRVNAARDPGLGTHTQISNTTTFDSRDVG